MSNLAYIDVCLSSFLSVLLIWSIVGVMVDMGAHLWSYPSKVSLI